MELKDVVLQGLAEVNSKVDGELKNLDRDFKLLSDRLQDIEQKGVNFRPGAASTGNRTGIAAAIRRAFDADGFKAFKNGAMTSGPISLGVELKALTSIQGSPEVVPVGADVPPEALGIYTRAQRRLNVVDVLQTQQTSSNTVGFNRLSLVGTEMAADYQEGEGTEKTEAQLLAEWEEAYIPTIAVHTTVSKQLVDDLPQLENAVDNLLRYTLANRIDFEVMNGDGLQFHMNGLLTQAPAFTHTVTMVADRIGQAASALSAQGYSPQVVFVNPADWFAIASERSSTDDHYIGGGWNAPANPNIYGLRVVQSSAIPVGEALVIDPAVATIVVREQPTVAMSREHNGNFTKNLVTILAEARLTVVVTDTAGMTKVDLAVAP